MAREIERKFLVSGDGWREDGLGVRYVQGYLSRDPERVVRVRRAGDRAFITVKGLVTGVSRPEFEYEIPAADAEEMFRLCMASLIEKTRTKAFFAGKCWEVDEFHGDNAGLVLAEIELEHEGEAFERPPWLGDEVSDDFRYYNASLSERPYCVWGRTEGP